MVSGLRSTEELITETAGKLFQSNIHRTYFDPPARTETVWNACHT
jgi:hypothetical protein